MQDEGSVWDSSPCACNRSITNPPAPVPAASLPFWVACGEQTDGAKLLHKHRPLTQIHLSRAGPRVQGISAGLGTGSASLVPPAGKRTWLLGDSCLSFPTCKAGMGVLGYIPRMAGTSLAALLNLGLTVTYLPTTELSAPLI